MRHDDEPKAGYETPEILELGDAAELTTGNGPNYVDYLGNTDTKYTGP